VLALLLCFYHAVIWPCGLRYNSHKFAFVFAQSPAGRETMLVLSRKVGEKILIGDNISITVVRVAQGMVRIGIEAPQNLSVVREEIKDQMRTPAPKKVPAASQH